MARGVAPPPYAGNQHQQQQQQYGASAGQGNGYYAGPPQEMGAYGAGVSEPKPAYRAPEQVGKFYEPPAGPPPGHIR